MKLRATSIAAAALLLMAFWLTGCATVKIKTDNSHLEREGLKSARLLKKSVAAPFSLLADFADKTGSMLKQASTFAAIGETKEAAGVYLKAAADAHQLLTTGAEKPGSEAEKELRRLRDTSLARFAELWAESGSPTQMDCEGQPITVRISAKSAHQPGYFDEFIAADSVKEKGVVDKVRSGRGAALVGVRQRRPERTEEMRFFGKRGIVMPVTLTLESVSKSGATICLHDPITDPADDLAADFTAPVATVLSGQSESEGALLGFFDAEKRIKQSGIFLTEPYDPNRIPVILTHGLMSVPIIWRNIVPELMAEPDISRRYQIMVFTYPTSFPVIQSAKLFRENLAALRAKYDPDGNDPLSTGMVAAGHSMGGILTHTLVADIDDRLWKQFSDTPFDKLEMTDEERTIFGSLAFFEPDPAVERAIFLSTPHRGSVTATKSLNELIARTAILPGQVLRASADLLTLSQSTGAQLKIDPTKKATAVQSLKPGAPVTTALDQSPYRAGVVYHSIIGDRGKGDSPNSSDGVVEYWSSHQDGAASELIVPTDHGSYKHPKAIAEIKRILREYALQR
jgi:pimeloyl-ACP methyl ester carboxylesterase